MYATAVVLSATIIAQVVKPTRAGQQRMHAHPALQVVTGLSVAITLAGVVLIVQQAAIMVGL